MPHFEPEGNIDVEDFLDCLEIRNVTVRGDQAFFSCPFPGHANGDDNPSATMNMHTTQFFCYGCKERGNAISFTQHVLSISPIEAIRILKQRYQPGGINPDAVSMLEEVTRILNSPEPGEKPQPVLDEQVLARFDTDWFAVAKALTEGYDAVPEPFKYMQRRGFGPDVLVDWEFGYDTISDRITIPVRDVDGTLIGIKARAYDDRQPKYLILGDKPDKPVRYGWPCYFNSRVCFGAHRLPGDSDVVVCEGELNAIAVASRAKMPAVAISGSHFSERHARILRHYAKRVILFLDDDKAGREAVWGWVDSKGVYHPGIVERLKNFVPVLLAPRSEKDAAELSGAEITELLSESESALLRSLAVQ